MASRSNGDHAKSCATGTMVALVEPASVVSHPIILMSKNSPVALVPMITCALCGVCFDPSRIAMRGSLNFCETCTLARTTECLMRMKEFGRPKRFPLMAALLVGLTVCGGIWTARSVRSTMKSLIAAESRGVDGWGSSSAPSSTAPGSPSMVSGDPADSSEGRGDSGGSPLWGKFRAMANAVRRTTGLGLKPVVDVGNIQLLFVIRPGTDGAIGLASRLYATKEAPETPTAALMTPVGDSMKASFQEGLRYVRKQSRDWEGEFSIRLSFEDRFSSKDGGSAGTGFTVEMLAAIDHIALDPNVAITGDLTIDGEVQPVGAVVEKLRGAIAGKCRITLIPERNNRDVLDLALLDGTSPLWETQILSISTIDAALALVRKDRAEKTNEALQRFDQLRARLPAVVTPNYLQSPVVQSELKEVLRLAPNHLSAATLLKAAEGQLPKVLSLNRSVDEIVAAFYLFVGDEIGVQERTAGSSPSAGITRFPEQEFTECMKKITALQPILDPRALELKSACAGYASALRGMAAFKAQAFSGRDRDYQWQIKENFDAARSRLLLSVRKLTMDGSLIREMTRK
jgi:Lon protease (S16) C-terminal proteolytic domain